MANYTKSTNFATKDSLASGNPLKVIKGTEIDDEFEAIETASATKADLASPALTGTPTAPTATTATDSTQIATTAFVKDAISTGGYVATAGIADNAITNAKMADDSVGAAELIDNSVGADAINVSGNGTSGQYLTSDGDGSMSWTDLDVKSELNATGSAPIFAARAWGRFNGNNASIYGSGNVASITRTGVGQYTITFTTAMPNTNYAFIGTVNDNTNDYGRECQFWATSHSTGSVTVRSAREETEQLLDVDHLSFVIFG